jgi:DNA-binding NtrC family response regulator/tetratricopeptide (TPR) repeat protein
MTMRQVLTRLGRGPVFSGSALGQHRPYAVLMHALREALAHLDAMGSGSGARSRHHAALGLLDPGEFGTAVNRGGSSSRLAFHEATLALVRDVMTLTGGTFLLTELEAAEGDSRALCQYLARHLCEDGACARGALILSVSSEPGPDPLTPWLADAPHVTLVNVGGLDREGLLRFLRNSSAVDRLLTASGGRPGDVDELLSALPLDVGALLSARLRRLGERAAQVAQVLSLGDAPLAIDAVSALTGLPAVALAPTLQALCEEGLVVRRAANGTLLFNLLRAAHAKRLAEGLSAETRARLHGLLGEHLEAKGAALMEGGEQELAEHFLAARDAVRGVPYAIAASDKLTVTHAYGTAVDLLSRALQQVTRLEDRQAVLTRLCELHHLRGDLRDAVIYAGRHKASLSPRDRGAAYQKLGELLAELGHAQLAVRQLKKGLALGGTGAESGGMHAALAEALYVAGDPGHARTQALATLMMPQLPELQRIRVRNTLGKLALSREDWTEATERFQENRVLAAAQGLATEITRAEINLGVMAFRRGQYDSAEQHLGRALKHAEETGDLPNQAFCVLNLGSLKHQRRDLGAALRLHHESLALFSKIGNQSEVARARLNVANISLVLGDLVMAGEHLAKARALMQNNGLTAGSPYMTALEADLCFARSEFGRARELYGSARQLYLDTGQRSRAAEQWLRCAQTAIKERHADTAEQALSHLAATRGDLDHARLRAETALCNVRLLILQSLSSSDAMARAASLLEEARSLVATEPEPEALAMVGFVESELWQARGDTRRAERVDAAARDQLHRVAQQLPPALRDAYIRTRVHFLGGGTPTPGHAGRVEAVTLHAPAPAEAPSGMGSRTDAWRNRYQAFVGDSSALLKVFARLDRLQGTTSTVLIRGESGTGKELVASAIHRLSPRANGPFVKVNCAALVETLLLSELFGHEKGAFTGAHARKVGRFELARGGTIFLDEIGDISAKTQVSLLRVLQERVFERVGGTAPLRADCRVICATNRNLEAMVKAGTFREDLYYRLKGVQVDVPSLRERRTDVVLLVDHVIEAVSAELGRVPPRMSQTARDALVRYDWPGNIRELENTVRTLVLFAEGDRIEAEHLREFKEFSVRPTPPRGAGTGPPEGLPSGVALGTMKRQLEFDAISQALQEARGNISKAAELLQMKRPRLSQIVNGNPALRAIKDRQRVGGEGGAA